MTEEKTGLFHSLKQLYVKKYKLLLAIPILLLILAFAQILGQYAVTGDFINRGVSLQGGVTVSIPEATTDILVLQDVLAGALPDADVVVRKSTQAKGVVIDAADVSPEDLIAAVTAAFPGLTKEEYSVEEIGSALGQSFFRETFFAILLAFLFMGIVVFIAFRTLIPSVAVILAAFSDIVVTLAIFNLTGIKLSTAGIAAFLMLIGYSVDTDVLLSTHLLKRRHVGVMESLKSAFKTGIMMSVTTICAITVALLVAKSDTIRQIMIILLIGLVIDIIMTWIQNAGILRWYLEKKHGAS